MRKKQSGKALFTVILSVSMTSCALSTGARDYEKGVLAYQSGEYEKAAGYFTDALEKNSDRAEYYLYYGFTLLELGEYAQAAENFEKVIQEKEIAAVRENNKRAYRGAGIAYYMAGENAKALSSFYAALQYEELPELDEDIRTYMMQANAKQLEIYRAAGALDKALEACGSLLEEYGTSADLYRIRADISMERADYESALADFDLAIEAGDMQMGTLLGKLQALQALGREEEARLVSEKIAGMTPANDGEALAAAIAAFTLREYDNAGTALQELYDNGITEAGYYLAQIAIAQEDYAAAFEYLGGREEQGVISAELYYQLAFCSLELNRTEQAAEYYQKLADMQDASYLRKQEKLYIVLLEHQGKWQEALERMEQYIDDYITEEDEESEEAGREYEFLKARQ